MGALRSPFLALFCAVLVSSVSDHDRLKILIENNDGDAILAEKDTFSHVIQKPFWPVNDCKASPLLYAITQHSNEALKALLQVPGVDPAGSTMQGDYVNGKYPILSLLHVAALATSKVNTTMGLTDYGPLVLKCLCNPKKFEHNQGAWDIILAIPNLDPNVWTKSITPAAHLHRFANCTPLHMAALSSDGEVAVRALLSMDGIDVNQGECNDLKANTFTATQLATLTGNRPAVEAFLELNPSVVEGISAQGETILHAAAMMAQPVSMAAILKAATGQALADIADSHGWTALHVACVQAYYYPEDHRFLDVAKVLLPYMSAVGANSRTSDVFMHVPQQKSSLSMGKTPLSIAIIANDSVLVNILLNHEGSQVDPNTPDQESSFTPLHIASYYNYPEIVSLLLQHPKIEVSTRTLVGKRTALHTACKSGSVETVETLMNDARVDKEALDGSGYKALDWAHGWVYGNEKIQKIFARYAVMDDVRVEKKDEL